MTMQDQSKFDPKFDPMQPPMQERMSMPRGERGDMKPMEVKVDGDNINRAINQLKRKMANEGIYKELKKRRFYEKPSERRKRKEREAERRLRKAQRRTFTPCACSGPCGPGTSRRALSESGPLRGADFGMGPRECVRTEDDGWRVPARGCAISVLGADETSGRRGRRGPGARGVRSAGGRRRSGGSRCPSGSDPRSGRRCSGRCGRGGQRSRCSSPSRRS